MHMYSKGVCFNKLKVGSIHFTESLGYLPKVTMPNHNPMATQCMREFGALVIEQPVATNDAQSVDMVPILEN